MATRADTTRRGLLKAAPGIAALAAVSVVPEVAEANPELPVEKVDRLAKELAIALNDWSEGQFHAVIHPSEKSDWPICFRVTRLENDPMQGVRRQVEAAKEAMARAYPGWDVHSYVSINESTGGCTAVIATERV